MLSTKRRAHLASQIALCVLPAAALFAFTVRHHEFWRDEVQALLIGRDVPFRALLLAMRYEGSPPLYHLILKVLCFVFRAPTALAIGGALGYAALLAGTLHLLRVVSRRPAASLAITLALGATNTYVYELGVVSRPYGLGLGLDLAGIAELLVARKLRQPRRALAGALLCGAAAITSDHAACVAGGALASFVIIELATLRARKGPLSSRLALARPTLAALPFFALTWYLMAPFADRTPEVATAGNPKLDGAFALAGNFLESGALSGGWWGSAIAPSGAWSFRLFAAGIALSAAIRFTRRRRDRFTELFPFGVVLLSWATLLYIFIAWYNGGYRHHLFLWIPALVFALGWLADHRFARGRLRLALVASALLLAPRIYAQWPLAWADLSGDLRGAFSQTKSAAALLPPDAHVVSDRDYSILGLRLWRDDVTLRSPDGRGRRFRTLIVDRAWHQRAPLRRVVADECRAAPDRTIFAHHGAPLEDLRRCFTPIQQRDALLPTERFVLYRVDCACVTR